MAEADGFVEMTVEVVSSYVSHNTIRPEEVPKFISSIHAALANLGFEHEMEVEVDREIFDPAVSVRKSLSSPDYIISLIDGKPYRSLKRHLSAHGLSPEEYRRRYGLKPDYPMVAPTYSAARRNVAVQSGLGRRVRESAPAEIRAGESARRPRGKGDGRGVK